MTIELFKTVFTLKDLPPAGTPEFVLCGRSNVGKSSLINSLFKVKNLAKVSSTPGKTRSLNFYTADKKVYFVDLPGYGYAKAAADEKEKWNKLILGYLNSGRDIKLVVHIMDSRLEPQKSDIELYHFFSAKGYKSLLVMNKVDKLNQRERSSAVKNFLAEFPGHKLKEDLVFYSSVNGEGRADLMRIVKNMII